jgi:hypothetical protein
MGAINGSFSPDGSLLIIGTDYGAIQVIGAAHKELLAVSPNEQFYRTEDEEVEYVGGQPFSILRLREVNGLPRGPVCNGNREPYASFLENDIIGLLASGFLTNSPAEPQSL